MSRFVSDEELQGLKAKDARARKVKLTLAFGDVVEIVVRPASRAEYQQFKQLSNSDKPEEVTKAREQLLVFCSLSPDPKTPELQKLVDQYPAIPDSVWPTLGKMAGITSEIEVGE